MIGGDAFLTCGKRAKSNGARVRSTTWISASPGAAWTTLTRVARPELKPGIELLRHPVGERADLLDMRHHRRAPADRKTALLRRGEPARAEKEELLAVRSLGFEEWLGEVEHSPVEHAGEALLGADRNDEMAVASVP